MDVEAIFSSVGARVPSANSPLDRVPLLTVIRLLETIQAETDDPCAPLKLYGHMKLAHLDVLGFALSCSSTLMDFFERAQRFCDYLGSAFLIEIDEGPDKTTILGRWNPDIFEEQIKGEQGAHFLMECLGYWALGIMHDIYGDEVPIRSIHLPEKAHEKVIEAFATSSRAPIKTTADYIGVELDLATTKVSLPGDNPQLARENDRLLTEQLATMYEHNIVHRCEQLIIDGMQFGDIHLQEVANQLGTSERSLRQDLHEQGQSFSGLVARIKKTIAIQYLQEDKKNVGQIAFLLGFESPSNFSRAFKSWTGYSPREYRKQHRNSVPTR